MVYSLDKSFGDLNCKSDILGEKLWKTPVIEGDTIYVGTFDGHICTLSTKTGKKLPWTFESEVGFVSSPVLYEDTIFVGSFDNNLYAIKVGEDKPKWKFPGGRWFWAAPVAEEGVVYAGCLDGKIYAVDAETGKGLWEFDTKNFDPKGKGSPIVSSPVVMDGLLVVASESGDVYIFDAVSKPEDKQPTPVKVISVGAIIQGALCVHDGIVYVRAQDNCLYALDIAKGGISWKLSLSVKSES
jgi:outer membrane protein assembly factor BamB